MTDALIIITGISRGLGRALVEQAVARGNLQVLGIHRGLEPDYAAFLREHAVAEFEADLASPVFAENLAPLDEHLAGAYRHVYFVNNASVIEPLARIGDQPTDPLVDALHVNVIGPALLLNRVLAGREERDVTLVHITSGAASKPKPGWGAYCAGKAAAHMLFAVAQAERPDMRVFEIDPGVLDTDMQAKIRATSAAVFPDVERFRAFKSAGKLLSPDSVAAQILDTIGL